MRYIFKNAETNEYYIQSFGKKPSDAIREWPQNINPLDFPYCVFTETESGLEVILDEGKKAQAEAIINVVDAVKKAKDKMRSEVNIEMAKAFGTTDEASANAFFSTWQEWIKDPSRYFEKGYVSHMEVKDNLGNVLFSTGEALNTSNKIKDFAEICLQRAKNFGDYRAKRISDYILEAKALKGD